MGPGSKNNTQTTTSAPSPEQAQLMQLAMPSFQQFAATPLSAPGSSSVSPFDPLQTQGQNDVLSGTGTQRNIVGSAGGASQFLTSGAALDPNSDPALKGSIDAAVRPIYENLTDKALPAIRGDAAASSGGGVSANYGGSRQGIAEGIASRGASTAAGDASSKIVEANRATSLDAMTKALGLAPATAQGISIPGVTESTVGDVRQQQAQTGLTADTSAAQFAQWAPLMKALGITGAIPAMSPGGSTTSVGSGTTSPGGLQTAIGLGGIGAGLLGSGGVASLLPFLSDMRAKRDIEQIGILFDGIPVYRFRYAGNDLTHIGLLAQDVKARVPDAVVEVDGTLYVDYKRATQPSVEIKK